MTKRQLLIVSLVLIATVLLVAYYLRQDRGEPAEPSRTLVVGIHSWPGDAPIYVGQELGFFQEEGVDLDLQRIESFDSRRAALIGEQIDIDCTTLDQLLIVWEAGFQAQVFGISDFSTGGDGIVAKKEIEDLQGLRGRVVAYAEASPSDFFLRYILKREGILFNEILPQPVADAQAAGTAILAEQVDAAVTFEPWLSESAGNENLRLLASTSEYPSLIPGLFVARSSDLLERAEVYRGFMRAWYRSVEYFRQNPSQSKEWMAAGTGLGMEDIEAILGTITIVAKEGNLRAFDREAPDNMYDLVIAIAEFWRDSGFVTKQFEPELLVGPKLE